MNLKITSQINTSTGKPITNAVCFLNVNTDYLLSQNKMIVEPVFHVDLEAKTNKYDSIIPVTLDDNELIIKRIGGFEITFTNEEIAVFTLLMPFTKAKTFLQDTYGWTITIE
jgi:hypothetical protein